VIYTRRRILELGGAAASLALLSRCASRVATTSVATPSRPMRRLARVDVAPGRIIRRLAGLRPFRPGGFVVRAEPLGDKLLVHDYGHGGAGVTLSWGTAELAADLVRGSGRSARSAAVIGCGAVGLAAARVLQERGLDVTIYARELPPGTTSMVAGAMWYPSFVFDRGHITDEFRAQFERAQRAAHRRFQTLVGTDYAVRWREIYVLSDDPENNGLPDYGLTDLYPARRALTPGESPFAAPRAVVESTMFIEPPPYLRALMRDFRLAGGRIVVRDFATPGALLELAEPVVVNCTGLGARELFGDRDFLPMKGQLTVLLPQPEVDYAMESGFFYMFPRTDGILLGGTYERGVETMDVDPEAEQRILAGQRAIFEGMRAS
jgi:glycine/D-amino acid oxidase-like deaminating enzyme